MATAVNNPAGVFVGRRSQLTLLGQALADAAEAGARLLLIEGEAGSGKTSLVGRFLRQHAGLQVAAASGDEGEALLAYGVVEQLAAHAQPLRAALGGQARPAPDTDPVGVGSAIVQALGTLSTWLVIVVDDAHWADAPSLRALLFAFRRLHSEPVLLVLALRSGVPATRLDPFRRLAAGDRGSMVHLSGLGRSEVADLAAAMDIDGLSGRFIDRLIDHTGGSPLHLSALFREEPPAALAAEGAPLPAPRSFRLLVTDRLRGCDAPTQALVLAAAVLGQRAPLPATAAVAGLKDPAAALDEAIGADLLAESESGTGTAIAFTHPLVRAAVYHHLPPSRRVELHLRAADVLEGVAALEHRAAACLGSDDELAGHLADAAGQEASAGAWAAAASHLRMAARLTTHEARREELVLGEAEVLLLAGEAAELATLLPQLDALPPSGRRDFVLGYVALLSGDPAAEALLEQAWKRCDRQEEPALAATIAVQLGQLAINHADGEGALHWAKRALDAGQGDESVAETAPSLLMVGMAMAGRITEALALAVDLPEDLSSPAAVEWRFGRGGLRSWSDDLAGGIADMTAATDARSSWRAHRARIVGLGHLAEAEYRAGAWDDSIAHAALALSLGEDTDNVWLGAFLNAQATYALAGRGKWEDAERHAATALAAAQDLGVEAATAFAATAAGHLALAKGDAHGVIAATDRLVPIAGRDGVREPGILLWQAIRADALIAGGREDEGVELLAWFESLARARGRRSALADCARVRGNLAATRGDAAQAGQAFQEGLALAAEAPWLFQRALLHEAHGRYLRRAGRRRAAVGQLEAALALFAAMGAPPFETRIERELAACGRRVSRDLPGPLTDLTPQELAVARLVAQGLSNREVATQLVVSVKTVEYHLRNLFIKLGVRSRTQLAVAFHGRAASGTGPAG